MFNHVLIGNHPNFSNITIWKDPKTKKEFYEAKIGINHKRYSKLFDDAEKEKRFIDMKCIENSVPQKFNSYKQIS